MKKLLLIALTMMAITGLFGCEGGSSTVNKDGAKILNMWVHIAGDTLEGRAYRVRAEAFNEANKGVYEARVEFIPRGGGGTGYEDKINAALTTSSLPDVITLDGPNTAAYAKSGILLNLDDLIPQASKDDFLPSALEQGMYNGSLYSLAIQESTTVVYYNKTMFVQAGLCASVETCNPADIKDPTNNQALGISLSNPWTYNEFFNISNALKTHFNTQAISLPMGQDEMITYAITPFIWNNGGEIVSSDGLTASGIFNSTANVEAFSFLQSLFTSGIATDVPVDNGFYIGTYPMMLDGIWGVPILEITYKNEIPHWGVLPIPVGSTGDVYASTGSWAFGVTKTSKNAEGAALLADWMTSPESTNYVTAATGLIPAKISALNSNTAYNTGVRAILKEQLIQGGKARPSSVAYPEITDTFQRAYIELMVTSNPPIVQAVLDQYAASLQTKLNRHK